MNSEYKVLLDTRMDPPEVEALMAACLAFTAEDWLGVESGAPVSKVTHQAFRPRLRAKVDSDLRVWFELDDR